MPEKKVKTEEFVPKYGEWAFLLGVVLALIVGLFSTELSFAAVYILGVLALLGLIVGFMNIPEKETVSFLVATIALLSVLNSWAPLAQMITSIATQVGMSEIGLTIVTKLANVLSALAAFVAPAALVVSLKLVYDLASK
ncbi:MAG: hypothetical protein QW153_03760 [Candidatus Bilamarchaeaceae archaeon]